MKKILIISIFFFFSALSAQADEIKRILVGNKSAKISIIAFESLTCSHCANFHKDVYPLLKKEYLDTGLAKIEFRHFPLDIAAFNASKAALTAYSKSVGRQLALEKRNIVMTALAPGIVLTEQGHWKKILKKKPSHAKNYLKNRVPLGMFGTMDETTGIIVFLASEQASFFHGSIIHADGGVHSIGGSML